jgi:hypothetical protein
VPYQAIPNANLRIHEDGSTSAPYPSSYAEWLSSARAPSTQIADADGDGLAELLEYALGTSATTGMQTADRGLRLIERGSVMDAIVLAPASITDAAFTLEGSLDLVSWTPLSIQPVITPDSAGWVRITWPAAPSLVRLRVTLPSGLTAVSPPAAWQSLPLNVGMQTFGLNVLRETLYRGLITASTATTLTLVDGISLPQRVPLGAKLYIELESGHRFDVLVSGENLLSLDPTSLNHTQATFPLNLTGTRLALREHATLGNTLSKTLLRSGAAQTLADQASFLVEGVFKTYWLQNNGTNTFWSALDQTTNADGTLLPPGTGLLLKVLDAPAAPLRHAGEVRTTAFLRPLLAGYQMVANPWPLALTPNTASLNSTAFLAAGSADLADQLQLWKGDSTPGLSGYTGFWFAQTATTPVWTPITSGVTNSQNDVFLLQPGRAIFLQTRSTGAPRPFWVIPPP